MVETPVEAVSSIISDLFDLYGVKEKEGNLTIIAEKLVNKEITIGHVLSKIKEAVCSHERITSIYEQDAARVDNIVKNETDLVEKVVNDFYDLDEKKEAEISEQQGFIDIKTSESRGDVDIISDIREKINRIDFNGFSTELYEIINEFYEYGKTFLVSDSDKSSFYELYVGYITGDFVSLYSSWRGDERSLICSVAFGCIKKVLNSKKPSRRQFSEPKDIKPSAMVQSINRIRESGLDWASGG